jgi:hypothetical protein
MISSDWPFEKTILESVMRIEDRKKRTKARK